MIKARHTAFHTWFFNWYTRYLLRKNFHEVNIVPPQQAENAKENDPVLLIGNHFSWWDGFIALYLNQVIYSKKFHVMMLEDELRARPFLAKTGAFSINKGSRTALESIAYAKNLLQDDQNLLVMYPQGKFYSIYDQNFIFEKGINRLLTPTPTRVSICFYAGLVEYFSNKKPSLFLYHQRVDPIDVPDHEKLAKRYQDFYHHVINQGRL